MTKLRVTRHGLTTCGHCGRHVAVTDACALCGGALGRGAESKIAIGIRGGLVAAALFGSLGAALAACGGGAAQVVTKEDAGATEPADTVEPEPPPENPPEPDYGHPPDPQPQPLYGVAPDLGTQQP